MDGAMSEAPLCLQHQCVICNAVCAVEKPVIRQPFLVREQLLGNAANEPHLFAEVFNDVNLHNGQVVCNITSPCHISILSRLNPRRLKHNSGRPRVQSARERPIDFRLR